MEARSGGLDPGPQNLREPGAQPSERETCSCSGPDLGVRVAALSSPLQLRKAPEVQTAPPGIKELLNPGSTTSQ